MSDHQYFTAQPTSLTIERSGALAIFCGDAPRKTETGTSHSLRGPLFIMPQEMWEDADETARIAAEVLNANANRFFESAKGREIKAAAATIKAAWAADFAHRDLVLAACFAAQAYEVALASPLTADGAPAALLRALLAALIDPMSADLDYLRADPASGAAARASAEGATA